MASFTDNSQALSQFNPYIQQIPVDDYVRVGIEKQQQYNQGVQRTQQAIDDVTHLPVIKQEQKDYLNDKVGQLKSSVSKVVGQDFSNSQLVNQIGGLTSHIASDPIIQSAVQSSIRYKNESEKMDEARKAGKSSIANETDFQDDFNSWINDGKLKTSFTGSYTPYTDVNAKALKAINDLHPNETLQQLPFQMENGKLKLVNGAPVIDSVMIQKMTKSLDANTIQTALNAALGPDEMNQLAIDGRYHYRGYSSNDLKQEALATHDYQSHQVDEIIKGLQVQKLSNTRDVAYQAGLDEQIKQYSLHKDSLDQKLPYDLQLAEQNPHAFKGALYQQNWISNMTNSHAYATNSLTYLKSPYEEDRLARLKDARESAQFMAEYGPGGFKAQQLDIERQKLNVSLMEAELRRTGKLDSQGNPTVPTLGSPVAGPVTKTQVGAEATLDNFNKVTDGLQDGIKGSRLLVAASEFPDYMNVDRKTGVITYKDKAAEAHVETGLARLRDMWIQDPGNVKTATSTYFNSADNIQAQIDARNKKIADISKTANSIVDPSKLYGNMHGLTIEGPGLGPTLVTASELADFNRKLNTLYGSSTPGSALDAPRSSKLLGNNPNSLGNKLTKTGDFENQANSLFISPKDRIMYNTWKKMRDQGVGSLTPAQALIMDRLHEVNKVTLANQEKVAERDKSIDQDIASLRQADVPAYFGIKTDNKGQLDNMRRLTNGLMEGYKGQGGDILTTGTKAKDVADFYKSDKTTWAINAQGDGQYFLNLQNSEFPDKTVNIPIDAKTVEEHWPGSTVSQFAAIKQNLALTKYDAKNTSDVLGTGERSAYVLQNPNLKQFAVKFHVEDVNRNGQYQVQLYILDRSAKTAPNEPPKYIPIDVNLPSLLGENGLSTFISTTGDAQIKYWLSQQKK